MIWSEEDVLWRRKKKGGLVRKTTTLLYLNTKFIFGVLRYTFPTSEKSRSIPRVLGVKAISHFLLLYFISFYSWFTAVHNNYFSPSNFEALKLSLLFLKFKIFRSQCYQTKTFITILSFVQLNLLPSEAVHHNPLFYSLTSLSFVRIFFLYYCASCTPIIIYSKNPYKFILQLQIYSIPSNLHVYFF